MMITDKQIEEWRTANDFSLIVPPRVLMRQRKALSEEVSKLRRAAGVLLRIVEGVAETCPEFIGEHCECLVCGNNEGAGHEEICPVLVYHTYFKGEV